MKYIRTKSGFITTKERNDMLTATVSGLIEKYGDNDPIIKQANAIKDLCDELVIYYVDSYHLITIYNGEITFKDGFDYSFTLDCAIKNNLIICGAIWIKDKNGLPLLKPVAKMNEKGNLELL